MMLLLRLAVAGTLMMSVAQAEDLRMRVVLRTPKAAILVGEPLTLALRVMNGTESYLTTTDVYDVNEGSEPDIKTLISKDAKNYREFDFGLERADIERGKQTKEFGESWTYSWKVLYSRDKDIGLAFDEPGVYFVKVRYPLWVSAPEPARGRHDLESDVLCITVSAPTGDDAEFLQRLRDGKLFDLMQFGRHSPPYNETIESAAALLRDFPGSPYSDHLRDSLRPFDPKGLQKIWTPQILNAFRRALRDGDAVDVDNVTKDARSALLETDDFQKLRELPQRWKTALTEAQQKTLLALLLQRLSSSRPLEMINAADMSVESRLASQHLAFKGHGLLLSQDVYLENGRCAWAIEQLLGCKLYPFTEETSKDSELLGRQITASYRKVIETMSLPQPRIPTE